MSSGARLAAVACVAAAAVIWSTSFAVTKVVLEEVPPLTIGAVRFSVAALLLAVVVRLQPGWRPPPRRERRSMAVAGLLGITAYFALENIGVEMSTAADATLIVASYPVLTLLLERALGRARITGAKVAGMVLAFGGVALIVQGAGAQGGSQRLWGNLLLLLGGVVWAVYNVIARSLRTEAGSAPTALTVTYYQTCAGAAGFVAMSPLEVPQWRVPGAASVLLLVYLAVACSVLAFLLYNTGLRSLTGAAAVNILNLVPVFGMVSAVVVAGETITGLQVLGGAVVVAGVTLGSSSRGERPPPVADPALADDPDVRPQPAAVRPGAPHEHER